MKRIWMLLSAAARSRSQFTAAAVELSQMVLGPVADDLGRKRLLIVADGALHFIPFAALPKPRTDDQMKSRMVGQRRAANRRDQPSAISDRQSPNPLILDHEIVNLPSASVLGMLQRRRQTRPVARSCWLCWPTRFLKGMIRDLIRN